MAGNRRLNLWKWFWLLTFLSVGFWEFADAGGDRDGRGGSGGRKHWPRYPSTTATTTTTTATTTPRPSTTTTPRTTPTTIPDKPVTVVPVPDQGINPRTRSSADGTDKPPTEQGWELVNKTPRTQEASSPHNSLSMIGVYIGVGSVCGLLLVVGAIVGIIRYKRRAPKLMSKVPPPVLPKTKLPGKAEKVRPKKGGKPPPPPPKLSRALNDRDYTDLGPPAVHNYERAYQGMGVRPKGKNGDPLEHAYQDLYTQMGPRPDVPYEAMYQGLGQKIIGSLGNPPSYESLANNPVPGVHQQNGNAKNSKPADDAALPANQNPRAGSRDQTGDEGSDVTVIPRPHHTYLEVVAEGDKPYDYTVYPNQGVKENV